MVTNYNNEIVTYMYFKWWKSFLCNYNNTIIIYC